MNNRNLKTEKRLLLLVDPQVDFITGSLPVPDAERKMNELASWLASDPDRYAWKVISRDWHNDFHCSFRQNGGKWPTHCVANSAGAEIWPALQKALNEMEGKTQILNKGLEVEEYSVFDNSHNRRFLENLVMKENIDKIDICGIAGDVCVLETLKHAINIFGAEKLEVLQKFSPSLDNGLALEKFALENLTCAR